MNSQLRKYFQKFLKTSGYCTPPGRAACALRSARTLIQWNEFESAGLVRIDCEPELENYFDVYGDPDSKKVRKAIESSIERDGLNYVFTEYFDGKQWHRADGIGMCIYHDPTDPFENDYAIDLMSAAIDQVDHSGEH